MASRDRCGRRKRGRPGFTILELVISTALLGVISYAAWDAYVGGTKETATASDHLTATQGAFILMESIREDLRQMSIVNQPNCYLIPNSLNFSTNGKSFIIRKSTSTNVDGTLSGSSFSVVIYQLVKHPQFEGLFTIRRLEGTSEQRPAAGADRETEARVFSSLLLKDIRFDLIVKLEQMVRYRTFIRISVTAASGPAGRTESKVYLISNIFETTSPEYIHNRPGQVGFARRFLLSSRWNLAAAGAQVLPGLGYYGDLPPPGWPGYTDYFPLRDYVDVDGTPRDFPVPPTAGATDPFDTSALSLPPLRRKYIETATEYLRQQFGDDFNGRILGQIFARPDPAAGPGPAWVEPFSMDASNTASAPIAVQLDQVLERMMARGPSAVEDMGHTLFAHCYDLGETRLDGTVNTTLMITPQDSQDLIQGR